jgi:hypothetical protein
MTQHEPPERLDPDPIRSKLKALYAELDREVAAQRPVCRLSGRCCRFREYGHTLFVSAAEFALLVADAPPPLRPIDDGDTCPWQNALGHCTARDARPIGCRVYYCDPAFEPHVGALSERFVAELKRLVDQNELPWHYAPLHHHLRAAEQAGRIPPNPAAHSSGAPAVTTPSERIFA